MSALVILKTSLLLGLSALLAGAWGVLYALARLRETSIFGRSAAAAYGLHILAALTVILWTPLELGWKCLVGGSSLVFFVIPPMTWRFLQSTHGKERLEHDR
jgi:hypothetical protein